MIALTLSLNVSPRFVAARTPPDSSITSRDNVIVGGIRAMGGDGGVVLEQISNVMENHPDNKKAA